MPGEGDALPGRRLSRAPRFCTLRPLRKTFVWLIFIGVPRRPVWGLHIRVGPGKNIWPPRNADNPEVLRSGGSGGVAGISTFMSRTGVAACGRIRTLLSLSNRELATAGNLLTEFLRAISRGGHRGRIACTTIAHRRNLAYVLGPPNGIAPYAEAVAAALNRNCNFRQLSPAASLIERKVIAWVGRYSAIRKPPEASALADG